MSIAGQTETKDTARPKFYRDAIENPARSKEEGRPIYDEIEMVEVRMPGDRLTVFVSPVEDVHRARWPEIYAAFKRGEERAASGTPLEHWASPEMTRSRVAELKACNILSVEELADVPDNVLPRLGMGGRALREQARAYLAAAKGGADVSAMAAQIAKLQETVAALQGRPAPAPAAEPAPEARTIEDHSDDELRAYILRQSGRQVRVGTPRVKLVAMAAEIATGAAEAA